MKITLSMPKHRESMIVVTISAIAVALLVMLIAASQPQTAHATEPACDWANQLVSFNGGAGAAGSGIDAVGEPDEVTVSLGQGGEIILGITSGIGLKPEIIPGDFTPDFGLIGALSSEAHTVMVSEDGVTYFSLGPASTTSEYDIRNLLPATTLTEVFFVKITDDGVAGADEDSVASGYDLDALEVINCVSGTGEGVGRFTGGGHQIRADGVRVTRGLTIHCDLVLSNNLEINWLGNSFHMTEHLTTVSCTDDPDIIQAPPAAPLDTLVGVGTGRYNNVDGFTIEFTLVDAGEPGSFDKMAILVYETDNAANEVLNVPLQFLDGGNLQAHFDQPHK